MRTLLCRFGREAVTLWTDRPGSFVYIYRRSGQKALFPWLGGMNIELARRTPDARPVKISAISAETGRGLNTNWIYLYKEQAILGCLFNHGVYAVLDKGEFKIVNRCEPVEPQKRRK